MKQMLSYRTVADWNMFWDSSNGIEEYITSVIGVINKCFDDVVPTVTVRTYPNQKPWITGSIRTELNAKHQYRTKIESYSDARRMWQGLQTITD
jgi:hypothetical protein